MKIEGAPEFVNVKHTQSFPWHDLAKIVNVSYYITGSNTGFYFLTNKNNLMNNLSLTCFFFVLLALEFEEDKKKERVNMYGRKESLQR